MKGQTDMLLPIIFVIAAVVVSVWYAIMRRALATDIRELLAVLPEEESWATE